MTKEEKYIPKEYINETNDPFFHSLEVWNILVLICTTILRINMFDYQAEILRAIMHHSRVAVVASRQIGKSVAIALLALAWALHKPNQMIVIISTGERQVKELLTKRNYSIKKIYKRSKRESETNIKQTDLIQVIANGAQINLSYGINSENAEEIEFDNGSRIIVVPCNANTASGFTADLLIGDEVAKMPEWNEMFKATFPAVSRQGGHIALFSSVKGKNHWWDIVCDKKTPENPKGWLVLKYPITVNPPPDLEQLKKDFTEEEFNEEFMCIPVDEAHSLFPFSVIDGCATGDFFEWF